MKDVSTPTISDPVNDVNPALVPVSSPLCLQLEVLEVINPPLSAEKLVDLLRSRFKVDITEALLYFVSQLREITVDIRCARVLRAHPSVVGCLVRELILNEQVTTEYNLSYFNLLGDFI